MERYRQNEGSIMGMCYENRELLREESHYNISHKHTYSQGLLLAMYLVKEQGVKVDLVTCDQQLKGVGHLIAEETEADRLGFVKEAASKEGVQLRNLAAW